PDRDQASSYGGCSMSTDLSKICADFIRSHVLTQSGAKLKASHARELVAAFFGYKSHAALLAEKDFPLSALSDADVMVPAVALIESRRADLEGLPADVPESGELAKTIADLLVMQSHFARQVW